MLKIYSPPPRPPQKKNKKKKLKHSIRKERIKELEHRYVKFHVTA